uniref:Splicing factor Cactin C-terminal domain-containing protein n=1 Tax=Romanomermis culicivorax TaxID=13658 RepID=A0A915L3B2_ROMCU
MYEAYEKQVCYSPTYISEDSLPAGTEIVDTLEDQHRIQFSRAQLKNSGSSTSQSDAVMEKIARKDMGDDERQFSNEAPLVQQTYLWSDKYRPRKPRYFNRVHTGFEWNKYNQTHYDLDNAPPKIVQGYKFNIFYPDLLDPSKAPEFALTPDIDSEDFAILRFKAGPPYEDIAFKVVNREWEVSHKRGYRCQFQNGIFQLWFHFKKYRYRR